MIAVDAINPDYVSLAPYIVHAWRTDASGGPKELGIPVGDVRAASMAVVLLLTDEVSSIKVRDARGMVIFRWRSIDASDEFLDELTARFTELDQVEAWTSAEMVVRELRVLRAHAKEQANDA